MIEQSLYYQNPKNPKNYIAYKMESTSNTQIYDSDDDNFQKKNISDDDSYDTSTDLMSNSASKNDKVKMKLLSYKI